MFTQSAGVPEIVWQSSPKKSRGWASSSEWRLYALPIQLRSPDGTTIFKSATFARARANAGRKGESSPSSLDSSSLF